MQQFFVKEVLTTGTPVPFSREITHQLKQVLKVRAGESVRIVDGAHALWRAQVQWSQGVAWALPVERRIEWRELPLSVTLALARIRREKWEWALQKSTELGVGRILPLQTARTIVQKGDNETRKRARYAKIVQEAAEQSERISIPLVEETRSFEALLAEKSAYRFIACARHDQKTPSLLRALERVDMQVLDADLLIAIGPEGGFTPEEVDRAVQNGFTCVGLGPRILRAETAACNALSLIGAVLEEKCGSALHPIAPARTERAHR